MTFVTGYKRYNDMLHDMLHRLYGAFLVKLNMLHMLHQIYVKRIPVSILYKSDVMCVTYRFL